MEFTRHSDIADIFCAERLWAEKLVDFILRMVTQCTSVEDYSDYSEGGPMIVIVIISFIPATSGMGQVALRKAT